MESIQSTHCMSEPRRRTRGRRSFLSGQAAEDQVARHYRRLGGDILDQRCRTPEGEIDLVADVGGLIVFVEVKHRQTAASMDAPVTSRQWCRLENAALHYLADRQQRTGKMAFCRFDVALTGRDGSFRVIENARSFDSF